MCETLSQKPAVKKQFIILVYSEPSLCAPYYCITGNVPQDDSKIKLDVALFDFCDYSHQPTPLTFNVTVACTWHRVQVSPFNSQESDNRQLKEIR